MGEEGREKGQIFHVFGEGCRADASRMPRCAVIADPGAGGSVAWCRVVPHSSALPSAKPRTSDRRNTDIRQKEYVTLLTRSVNSTALPEAREGAGVSTGCSVPAAAPHAAS